MKQGEKVKQIKIKARANTKANIKTNTKANIRANAKAKTKIKAKQKPIYHPGRGYMSRLLINVGISTVIAMIVDTFLVVNISAFTEFLYQTGSESPLLTGFTFAYITNVLLYVLFGIVVFTFSFLILQRKTERDIDKIAQAMERISEGELDTEIDIEEEGELQHIASSITKMEHDIKELIQKERDSEKSKNDLITNVAHDLRTPLTSILGYLELLKNPQVISVEMQKKYVDIVLQKAKRLQKLIEELFGFTTLEYGQMNMTVKRVDIVKLLTQLVEENYPNFEKNDLSYEFIANTNSQFIEADGDLLARLFENLISNAIKYGADGKRVIVRLRADKKEVVTRIVNYGFVIPESELPMVFDKFYRVESSRSTSTGGTGLGLAIVKNIVEMHHGIVSVSSDLSGTCFSVRLPIRQEEEVNAGMVS